MAGITGLPRKNAALLAGICVALLCALGLGLRISNLDALLPHSVNRDGLVVIRQAELMRSGVEHPERDRLWALYPHLMSRLVSLLPDDSAARMEPSTLEQDLARANAPWVQGRLIVAILSLLVVPGTYFLARNFLGRVASLFAAGLMATSLFHVHVSTQEKPHAIVASFILLAIVAAIRLRRRGDVGSYLLCGAFAGLAIGSLHDGVAALLPLCAAHLLREKRPERASGWWILASFAIVLVCVRIFYPFHFGGGHTELESSPDMPGASMSLSGHKVWFGLFNGGGFPRVFGPVLSCDPVLLVLAIVGAFPWVVRVLTSDEARRDAWRGDVAVVLAFAIPFLLLVTMYEETMGRYAIPLLPLMACVAAYGVENMTEQWSERPRGRELEAVFAAVILLVASLPACRLWTIRRAPDTFERAAIAIARIIDPRDRIVFLPYFDVPLYHAQPQLLEDAKVPWRTIWVQYQAQLGARQRQGREFDISVMPGERSQARRELAADPMGYFRRHGARYVLIEGFPADELLWDVRNTLRAQANLVRRVSPCTEDKGLDTTIPPTRLEDQFSFPYAWLLFTVNCMGGPIELYELWS